MSQCLFKLRLNSFFMFFAALLFTFNSFAVDGGARSSGSVHSFNGNDELPSYSSDLIWQTVNSNAGIKRYNFDGKPDLPHDAHIIDDNAYWFLGNGFNRGSSSQNSVISMNLTSGNISESTSIGKNYLAGNATVAYQGRLFSIGGKGNFISHSLNNLVEFDPTLGEWQQRNAAPLSRYGSQSQVYNDKIYVFGGYGFDSFNEGYVKLDEDGFFYTDVDERATWRQEIQVYDIASQEWSIVGDAPGLPIFWDSTIIDENVYFSAEVDWISSSNIINRYNVTNRTWDSLTLPASLVSKKITSVGHLLIVYGTTDYARFQNSGWQSYIYDTKAQQWFSGVPLPKPDEITEVFSFASKQNTLYLFEHANEHTDTGVKNTYQLKFDISVTPPDPYVPIAEQSITTLALENGDHLSTNLKGNVLNLVVSNQSDYELVRAGSGSAEQKAALKNLSNTVHQNVGDGFQFIYFIFNEQTLVSRDSPYGYHTPVKNDIEGIGQGIFDFSESYGSDGALESIVVLPTNWDLIYGPSLHEIGHRWGNYLSSPLDSLRQQQWFGWPDKDAYHWGYLSSGGQLGGWRNDFFNGNLSDPVDNTYMITDGGEGRVGYSGMGSGSNFSKFSELELYLMGLNSREEVADLFEPKTRPIETLTYPIFTIDDFNTITMADIIATNGERIPSYLDAKKSMNTLFVVVSKENITHSEWNNYIYQVDNFTRQGADDYTRLNNFWEATEGKASLETPNILPYLLDSDEDGVADINDAFVDDPSESIDTDLDGVGNNADLDDDGDDLPDTYELANGLNPLDAGDAGFDNDSDGLSNFDEFRIGTDINLADTDGDGINDDVDNNPLVFDEAAPTLYSGQFYLLPDLNADDVAEIGLLRVDVLESKVRLQILNGKDSVVLDEVVWADNYDDTTLSLHLIPDMNNNGVDEVGLFGIQDIVNNEGKPQVFVRDLQTGNKVGDVYNWVANWKEVSALVLADISGDGKAEIAIQGRFEEGNRVQLVVKLGNTNTILDTYSYPDLFVSPQYYQHSDIDGDGFAEVSTFGRLSSNNKLQVKLASGIDAGTKMPAYNFADNWDNVSWHRLDDSNGDGQDDWGLFGTLKADGRPQLINKDGVSPVGALQIFAWPAEMENAQFFRIPDMNNDGVDEVAAAGRRSNNGRYQFQIQDGTDRSSVLANYNLNLNLESVTYHVLPDLNGDEQVEIGFLGINSNNEWELVIQHGDAVNGEYAHHNLGSDWQDAPTITSLGDTDEDGLPDLLVYGQNAPGEKLVISSL